MMIYRPYREDLFESMQEAQEFKSEQAMKEAIVESFSNAFSIEDIVISEAVVDDKTTGWEDSRNVLVNKYKDKDYVALYGEPQAIGVCATKF